MPDPSSIQWLTVTDFSGGIRQLVNADGLHQFSPQPIGTAAAVDDNAVPLTFDCIALPGGGLGPLPFGFKDLYSGPAVPPDLGNTTTRYFVGGLHVPPAPIMDVAGTALPGTDSAIIIVNLNYGYSVGSIHRYRLYRYNAHLASANEINNSAGATPFYDTGGTINTIQGGFTPMCDYRSSGASAPTTPGTPYVIIGVCDPGTLGVNVWQFPRPGFSNRVGAYTAIKQAIHLLSHQGRLIVNGYDTAYQYSNNCDILHNDDTYWTVPNQDNYDNGGFSSSLTQATIGIYGAMGSASASELVVIRALSQGGMSVSSDLNSPVITDYTGIQGTNGCYVEGCWTPMGFVYGTKEGSVNVYVGGGRSQDLAPNMESGFWHQNLDNTIGQNLNATVAANIPPPVVHLGKFAYHNGFVFVPGNWVYEINTGAWWRCSMPADYYGDEFCGRYFATSSFGTVYAAPTYWGAGHPMIYHSNFETSITDSWQWVSQPIPIAKESEINSVSDFILEGMAAIADNNGAHIDVTLTSYPNGETYTIPTFSLATEGVPEVFRHTIPGNIRGTHVSVKIVGAALNPDYAGPIVMRFDLGLNQTSKVKNP